MVLYSRTLFIYVIIFIYSHFSVGNHQEKPLVSFMFYLLYINCFFSFLSYFYACLAFSALNKIN